MPFRRKTIEYIFPTNTGNILGNVAYEFPGQTLWIPETGRIFNNVEIEVFSRDNHIAAQNISGVLVGIKLGNAAYQNFVTIDTITNGGEDQTYLFNYNATSYFTTNFGTGISQTGAVLVQLSGTSQNQANMSAKLKLTYTYDDSFATTRIKTVRIPIESRPTVLNGTLSVLNSGDNIPALFNGYLPETSIVKRQVWMELYSNEASSFVSPDQIVFTLNNGTGGPVGTGPSGTWLRRFSVLNSSCWSKGIVDLTSSHAFTGISTLSCKTTGVASTCMSNPGGLLCATYEYDHTNSTGIFNSIFLDGFTENGLMGGTSGPTGSAYSTEFYIEESGIALTRSAILAFYNTATAFTFNIAVGNQNYTSYLTNIGGLVCGQQSLVHRIDGTGNNNVAFGTLTRGRNVLNTRWFSNTITHGNSLTAQLLLNYTSLKHPSGDGVHNHSIYANMNSFNADTVDRIIIQTTGAVPVETNYYINGVQLYAPYMTSAGTLMTTAINVALTGIEGINNIGSGMTNAYIGYVVLNAENALLTPNPPMSTLTPYKKYPLHVNHLGQVQPLNISGTRNWRIQNSDSVWSSLGQWTTYHSIFYPIDGNITNTTGGEVAISIIDDLSNQVLFTGGRVGDGSIGQIWYDNVRPIYVVAKQGSTNRGLSVSQGVDSGNFNISFGGATVNNISRTIVHPGMQGGLRA